jgi:hypothetical protein
MENTEGLLNKHSSTNRAKAPATREPEVLVLALTMADFVWKIIAWLGDRKDSKVRGATVLRTLNAVNDQVANDLVAAVFSDRVISNGLGLQVVRTGSGVVEFSKPGPNEEYVHAAAGARAYLRDEECATGSRGYFSCDRSAAARVTNASTALCFDHCYRPMGSLSARKPDRPVVTLRYTELASALEEVLT